jgi:hypothetical protein
MTGDPAAWHGLERAHVGYLNDSATGAAGYFVVVIGPEQATVTRLDWFDDPTYDQFYQAVVAVATVPETEQLLFGVARSSDLVLCAPDSAAVIRQIRLTGHLGVPEPYVRRHAPGGGSRLEDRGPSARTLRRVGPFEVSPEPASTTYRPPTTMAHEGRLEY